MPKWIPAKQRGNPVKCRYNLPIEFNNNQDVNSAKPVPSKYWSKKGKRRSMKLCVQEFKKSENKCDCWYNFMIWNYNDRTLKELELKVIFEKQSCE